ncbi:hypothetical protein K0T92_08475 [Paenibacillus oenotherae]|uniref:Uncharacterized protein n=1 Tax=Paenibacillus oenotherae TaxID=1435645 RepID=A0ABS7D4C9_9BACL|nr:hypothetical protein [Paenibacillus oenotherae]MBW7474779.1 hypothetical protein [Paenibacillus oenotherae]
MNREKMHYSLQSMRIAEAMLQLKVGSFFKRAIARLILMRVPDFIIFAQRYNNELKTAPPSAQYKKVKGDLAALQQLYNDYLSELRHQFAGHFKEGDFAERIEQWGNIKEDSMLFFVRHAVEIAAELDPSHPATANLDPHDVMVIERISALHDLEDAPRIGNDILALTRFNTGGTLHMGDLQEKPAMLNSLRIIVQHEAALLQELRDKVSGMAIKTLAVVDVVNFGDVLFTRPVGAHAVQHMEGLDTIVARHNISAAVALFDEAKLNTRILERIEAIRQIRHVICAHIDGVRPLTDLCHSLDGLSMKELFGLYEHMHQLYLKVCQTDRTLVMSQLPNDRLSGVYGMSYQPSAAYDEHSMPPTEFEVPEFDEATLHQYWDKLLAGIDIQESTDYFSQALIHSPELETGRTRTSATGDHTSSWTEFHHYNVAQLFVQSRLAENRGNPRHLHIFYQIIAMKNVGASHILAAMLVTEYDLYTDKQCRLLMLDLLYRLSDRRETGAIELLKREALSSDLDLAIGALHALVKLDVRHHGVRTLNRKAAASDISSFVLRKLETMTVFQQVVVCLTMMSYLKLNGSFHLYISYSQSRYCDPLLAILAQYVPRIVEGTGLPDNQAAELAALIANNNYSRASLLIGDALSSTEPRKSKTFYEIVADEVLHMDWRHDTLVISRALALLQLERYIESLETAEYLGGQNPTNKQYRFLSLDIAAVGKLAESFELLAEGMKRDFPLDEGDRALLEQLRAKCYS